MDSLVMEKRSPKSPLPKSSFLKSPSSKSPFPKSPMPKSPLYEKYKSRCAYGFISLFRFRQGHSKKLISDRRYLKRHDVGDGYTRNNHEVFPNIDKQCHSIDVRLDQKSMTVDSSNAEVKEITGEEMPIGQRLKNCSSAKSEHAKPGPEHVNSKKYERTSKTVRRPCRSPIYGCYDVATMENTEHVRDDIVDRSSRKLDSGSNEGHPKSIKFVGSDQLNEVNLQLHMSAATEAFINQKLIDGQHLSGDGENHQSRHFMDALEILNSNKDLFIKLLQDPNSLLAKHIEDLRDSHLKNQKTRSSAGPILSEHKKDRVRDYDPQSLEKIVVLRPSLPSLQSSDDNGIGNDSPQFHHNLRNVQQSVRPAFFPFRKMKRKLMGASRKEKQLMLTDGAVSEFYDATQGFEPCGEGACMDFSERTSFDSGARATTSSRKDQMDRAKNIEVGVRMEVASASESLHENSNLSIARHPKRNKHEMYVQSRVNLSEALKSGNAGFPKKQTSKTGDGMNSTSEYGFVTPHMRFSPYHNSQMMSRNKSNHQIGNKNNFQGPLKQHIDNVPLYDYKKHINQLQVLETKLSIADKFFTNEKMDNNNSFLDNDLSPRADNLSVLETLEKQVTEISKGFSHSQVSSEPDGAHDGGANQKTCIVNASEKNGSLDFDRLNLPAENHASSPSSASDYSSSPLSMRRVETFDKVEDCLGQPSPISVLEQFSVEDISSPLSTETRPSEPLVLPRQIGMEDLLAGLLRSPMDMIITSITSEENHGSILKCLCAVLQSSGLNLDEFSLKCHLSDQLYKISSDNHKLLRDYFIEVLLEFYECHLRFPPWLSFIKPKIRLNSKIETSAHVVMKYVDWDPVLKPPSLTMEQLLKEDVARPGRWMDIRMDTEDMANETVEDILEDFIMETITE